MGQINVLLVDDDESWLRLIEKNISFENDIHIVGKATNSQQSLEMARALQPDIVIMDINLSESHDEGHEGIYAASEIANELKIKTIMLSSLSDDEIFKSSFLAGAVHFIEKKDIGTLADEIRLCHRKARPINAVISELQRLKREELLSGLTRSEREIFELFETGLSISDIEEKLFKSRETIRNQIKSINKKLDAGSIRDAIKKVRKHGLTKS